MFLLMLVLLLMFELIFIFCLKKGYQMYQCLTDEIYGTHYCYVCTCVSIYVCRGEVTSMSVLERACMRGEGVA